jgi:hypothetical protein
MLKHVRLTIAPVSRHNSHNLGRPVYRIDDGYRLLVYD